MLALSLLTLALSCAGADSFPVKDVSLTVARRNESTASAERELKKHPALVGGLQTTGGGREIVLGKGPDGTQPATNFESHVVYSGGKKFKGPGPEADFVFAAISSYFAKILRSLRWFDKLPRRAERNKSAAGSTVRCPLSKSQPRGLTPAAARSDVDGSYVRPRRLLRQTSEAPRSDPQSSVAPRPVRPSST